MKRARFRGRFLAVFAGWLVPLGATYGMAFTDRTSFNAGLIAAGITAGTDTYETYSLGPISNGGTRGSFMYSFNSTLTQPAVSSDGVGGKALGGAPFDVFVGGDTAQIVVDWSIDGKGPNGEGIHLGGSASDIVRRGADGFWRYIIDNNQGTAVRQPA